MAKWDKSMTVKTTGVSLIGNIARLGLGIASEDDEDLATLKRLFVGSQLRVELSYDPNAKKDANGQGKFKAGDVLTFEGIAESSRVSLMLEQHTASLKFQKSAVDANSLGKFSSQKDVTLKVKRIGDATQPASEEDDGEDTED